MLTLVVLCLLFLSQTIAGNTQYAFQQISTRNGLSSLVRCLVVSHEKGYVWAGTQSGIGRFDGYELKKYLQGIVSYIIEDKEYTIWAITPDGVFFYNYQEDQFHQALDENGKPIIATSICEWTDGVLFGGEKKIYKYDYSTHRIKLLHALSPDYLDNITNLQKWDEQTLMCTNRWSHAVLIDIQTGQPRPVPFETNELIASLTDKNGNIWVAPYHQGVKCYSRDGRLLHSYHIHNSILQTNVILTLAERNGQIWMGTDGAGIYILDPASGKMSSLVHVPGDAYSLPVNSILCLYNDINNNVWAGSVRGGLINIREVGMKIYSDALPGTEYGLSNQSILSIHQDKDENIWIGTDGGGINRLNPATMKFQHYMSTWGDKIASIAETDKRHLLVSLFSKGLYIFDKQSGKYQPLIIINDSINSQLCQRGKTVNVFRDSPETILILSEPPYSYHVTRKDFTEIPLDKHIKEITGTLLPIYQNGTISYLHDYKRIYRIDSRKKILEILYESEGNTLFNTVSVDENENLWIGSNNGLGYYSPPTNTYTPVPNNLINEISSLICDKKGRVWLGTEGKLFAYLIQEDDFILYGESDGIIQNEYLEKPRLLSSQGNIYMGGVNGLLRISKQLPQETDSLTVLSIADIWVGGERMSHQITRAKSIEVMEQHKSIFIKIIAANKDIFRKPMFRYTLQGMDGQVSYSYQPNLTLNGLPVGTYQILASCSTRNGGWTKDYPILKLTILPPWYKSGWFTAGYIFVILAIITVVTASLWRRRENKLKWAMKEHEQQVYEEKVRFLININHELRTPLTLIHAPLKQLLETLTPSDNKYATIQSICKQSGRMKKLLNMVLDVRKMEVVQSTLHAEEIALNPWIEQLMEDFKPEADAKGVSLCYQPDEKIAKLCFDKEKCTTILTNLLINALKYSPDNSCITISATQSDDRSRVRISIADQGNGLKEVDIDSLFIRFYQGNNSRPGTGIGLSYSKILAEQHGGSIGAYDHGDTPGATFWFELPCDIPPGKITLQPQAYLNELLAPTQEIESNPEVSSGPEDTQERTLLIVDDNNDLTDYLQSALKDKFKAIRIAPDGEEALRICRDFHPDMVVSDIQMPRMNGYELCKHIKEDFEISHIPVILLTARNDEESRLYGYKNGADVYITKPFEVSMLYAMIRSQLNNRERMRMRYAEAGPLPQPEESTFSPVDEEFLNRLNKLINCNLDSPRLGVPFLSVELGLSRASLYKKLKTLTSMGANDYINKLRMERAVWLLTHSDFSIADISDQTGFSTSRYFSTVFKQYMGCTPTQYKEAHP